MKTGDVQRFVSKKILSAVLIAEIVFAFFSGIALAEVTTLSSSQTERVIVIYKKRVHADLLDRLEQRGAQIRHRFQSIPGISAEMTPVLIELLRNDKNVAGVYEDMVVHTFLDDSVPQIGADTVQMNGNTGVGIKVCIVDTGVDDNHPALNALIAEHDFVNNDSDATDDNGHGTHVAGIVSSRDSTKKGVAPGASLMAAKVLDGNGSGFSSDVIAGIDWCVLNGADVINMSLGGGNFSGSCDNEPLAQSANGAVDQGVVVVIASGNDGRFDRISSPACASKAMAIGAVDKSDNHASYSNGGSELDVTAPGTSINSTFLGGGFARLTGTSMATPHVAGVAALVLSANPALTPSQVRTILRGTAVDLGPSGFDFDFGYGRIDAFAAVQTAGGGGPPPPPPPLTQQVFFDDFENELGKWVQTNQFNWVMSSPSERRVPGSSSANNVAHADKCNTAAGCILTLKNAVDLSIYESAELSFWRYVDRSIDPREFLRIDVFDGLAWNTIFSWTQNQGDDDKWHKETFDLSQYLISNFSLRIVSKESSSIEDTDMDDVLILGTLPQSSEPIARAGTDVNVNDSDNDGIESVMLDASSSSDDGTIVLYTWEWGVGSISSVSAQVTADFAVGVHTVTLTVEDDEGEIGTDTVQVTVHANQSPAANAGSDQAVGDDDNDGSALVQLNGFGSSDPDGSITSYVWSEGQNLLGVGALLTVPFVLGDHTVVLTVADNGGVIDTDTVLISVTTNQAPLAGAGGNKFASDDDNNGTEYVVLDGSSSSDPDGTLVEYEWSEGGVSIGSGELLLVSLSLGEHDITLIVTDNGGETDTDTATITVLANQAPVADAGTDQTVTDENDDGSESITLNGTRSFDPDGSIVSYEWEEGGAVLGTTENLLHEFSVGTHTVSLTVTDNGSATTSDTVEITVEEFVFVPSPVTIFFDGFESGFSNWQNTDWVIESPSEEDVPGTGARNLVAHADNCDDPCELILSSPLDLSGLSSATLSFWRFVDRGLDDGEFLQVEAFDGTAWNTIFSWTDGNGDDDSWQREEWQLPASYLVPGFLLRFVALMSSSLEDAEFDQLEIMGMPIP